MTDPTVAIPARDGGELFVRTLAALAGQTRKHELLVCDSGSSDGSLELARAHGARVRRDRSGEQFGHGRHAQPADEGASGRARRAAHSGRGAGRTSAGSSGLLGGFELAPDVGIVYGPYRLARRRARGPLGTRALVRHACPRRAAACRSARASRAPGRTRPGCPRPRCSARVASSPTRTPASGARGLGARAVSRGRLRRGPRAGDRHAARGLRQGLRPAGRACCTPTTTRRFRSCAAASTSGAGCARSTAGASPASPAHLTRQLRGALGRPPRAWIREGASPRAAPRDARGRRPSPCRAPRGRAARLAGRSAASAGRAGGCRSRGAQASRRSSSTRRTRAGGCAEHRNTDAQDQITETDRATHPQAREQARSAERTSRSPRRLARRHVAADPSPVCAGAST